MLNRTLPVTTHGHYLLDDPPPGTGPRPLLIGFHGYAQNAAIALDELRRIPGAERWWLASVEGLHRFYSRGSETVVASWMTRADRELAIADNIRYVGQVVDAIKKEGPPVGPLVYVGFSQGAAMAYRAAAASSHPASGLIVLGGDVPPDLAEHDLARFPPVLIGRGTSDSWYNAARHEADLAFLRQHAITPDSMVFEGGHEWTDAFREACRVFLERLLPASRS
jgi:predicted esterase